MRSLKIVLIFNYQQILKHLLVWNISHNRQLNCFNCFRSGRVSLLMSLDLSLFRELIEGALLLLCYVISV